MSFTKSVELVIPAFEQQYNITRLENQAPFYALGESENNAYLFFAGIDILDRLSLTALDELAWETGLNLIKAHKTHINSDIGLVLVTNIVMPAAITQLKRSSRFISYKHMLKGWSHSRIVVIELSTGAIYTNPHGLFLKPLLSDTIKQYKKSC